MDMYEGSYYRVAAQSVQQDNEQQIVADAQAQHAADSVAEALNKDENGSR